MKPIGSESDSWRYASTCSDGDMDVRPGSPLAGMTPWPGAIHRVTPVAAGAQGQLHCVEMSTGQRLAAKEFTSARALAEEISVYEKLSATPLKRDVFTAFHGLKELNLKQVMVVDFVAGKDLKSAMNNLHAYMKMGLPVHDLNRVIDGISLLMESALYGLKTLERLGLSHGDIKADNMLLQPQGGIKVVDFGLSADLHSPVQQQGSYGYMGPEITKMESSSRPGLRLDKSRIDSYSAANLLLGLLCARQVSQSFDSLEDFGAAGTATMMVKSVHRAHIQRHLSVTRFSESDKPELALSPAGSFFYENARARQLIDMASTCIRSNWQDRPTCSDIYGELKIINRDISPQDRSSALANIGHLAVSQNWL